MKNFDWRSILCCPKCKRTNLQKDKHGYTCKHCKKIYPVRHGIPVFVDMARLPEHLKKQILYFEKEDIVRGTYALEPWQKRYVDDFLYFAKPVKNAWIIDNATGSGYMAIELAKRGYNVIATDLTLRELTQLQIVLKKLRLTKRVFLICCSSESLAIRSGVADGMVANAILEHLPQEKQAIGEIGRVLKKKAVLMVAMPIQFRYVFPPLWLLNWVHDRKIGHLRRYSRKIILKKFPKFEEITTFYTGHVLKVVCSVLYLLTKNRSWLKIAEQSDQKYRSLPYGSSNVVTIARKI